MKAWIKNHQKEISLGLYLLGFTTLILLFTHTGFDYFWHKKAGEIMMNEKRILTVDLFSWTAYQKPWISHEWLSEIILYLYHIIFKGHSITLYCGTFLLILYFFLYMTNKKAMLKNVRFTIIWFFLSTFMIGGSIAPRPQMISYVLLAITLFLLYQKKNDENNKTIYLLPIVSIIWANVHGGSSNLPYLLSLIFFLSSMISINQEKIESKSQTKKQTISFLIVTILSFLAITINPHGIKLLTYPYENMQDSFMLNTIQEWRHLNINNISDLIILIMPLITITILIKTNKKHDILDLIVLLLFTYLLFKSVRFAPLFFIASTYIVFKYIKEKPYHTNLNILLPIFGLIFITFFLTKEKELQLRINEPVVSNEMIETIKEHHPEHLYNYYDYGGYLIDKNIKVFIDGRADLYSKYNYKDFYHLTFLNQNYLEILEEYNFDYLLVKNQTPLAYYLKNNQEYQIIKEEKSITLYKKALE